MKRLEKLVLACADNPTGMPIHSFCGMLEEIVLLLGALGKALYIAFKDVKDKAVDMRKNKEFMVTSMNKP